MTTGRSFTCSAPLVLALLAAGCGGGSGGAPTAASPAAEAAAPPAPSAVGPGDFTRVAAVGMAATLRGERAMLLAEDLLTAALRSPGSGTLPCAQGGTITVAAGGGALVLTPNNCRRRVGREILLLQGGALVARGAVARQAADGAVLERAQVGFGNLVVRGGADAATLSGSLAVGRVEQDATGIVLRAVGTLHATSPSNKVDRYLNLDLAIRAVAANPVLTLAGSARIDSPRVAGSFLFTDRQGVATLTATDGSAVQMAALPGAVDVTLLAPDGTRETSRLDTASADFSRLLLQALD